ncbi:MAG: hypothetical protein KJO22_00685 [Bacteroidia bacterium]|nr:hypothetical protein [Winogradskyella sp.]MBT8375362.1 hypothetical protein [Bacteroidia bacterium]
MNDTTDGIILTLAYPETVVMVADEWYSPFLKYFGIGKKNYVRAGHAALVLIDKNTGHLEYHDFGRYITPEPYARVRGQLTDAELQFPLTASIKNGKIENLEELLTFLATHPKLTHGDGKLLASVCRKVDYNKAREHIAKMQQREFIRYAAFIKEACNCARFVTDTLIESVTDSSIVRKLKKSKRFTPSTIGNVLIADTENCIYEVTEEGEIGEFKSTLSKENRRLFLDRLKDHEPSYVGTLHPRHNDTRNNHAQWLSGIAAGAWFELYDLEQDQLYRFRRISPFGHIDIDAVYRISDTGFDMSLDHEFVQYSNCLYFHVKQNGQTYRFNYVSKF